MTYQPEVAQQRLASRIEEDIGRLQIRVHDPDRVSSIERLGDLGDERRGRADGKLRPTVQQVAERAAICELHGDHQIVPLNDQRDHLGDVWVAQPRKHLDLAPELVDSGLIANPQKTL
jgi:hypothetical protein